MAIKLISASSSSINDSSLDTGLETQINALTAPSCSIAINGFTKGTPAPMEVGDRGPVAVIM